MPTFNRASQNHLENIKVYRAWYENCGRRNSLSVAVRVPLVKESEKAKFTPQKSFSKEVNTNVSKAVLFSSHACPPSETWTVISQKVEPSPRPLFGKASLKRTVDKGPLSASLSRQMPIEDKENNSKFAQHLRNLNKGAKRKLAEVTEIEIFMPIVDIKHHQIMYPKSKVPIVKRYTLNRYEKKLAYRRSQMKRNMQMSKMYDFVKTESNDISSGNVNPLVDTDASYSVDIVAGCADIGMEVVKHKNKIVETKKFDKAVKDDRKNAVYQLKDRKEVCLNRHNVESGKNQKSVIDSGKDKVVDRLLNAQDRKKAHETLKNNQICVSSEAHKLLKNNNIPEDNIGANKSVQTDCSKDINNNPASVKEASFSKDTIKRDERLRMPVNNSLNLKTSWRKVIERLKNDHERESNEKYQNISFSKTRDSPASKLNFEINPSDYQSLEISDKLKDNMINTPSKVNESSVPNNQRLRNRNPSHTESISRNSHCFDSGKSKISRLTAQPTGALKLCMKVPENNSDYRSDNRKSVGSAWCVRQGVPQAVKSCQNDWHQGILPLQKLNTRGSSINGWRPRIQEDISMESWLDRCKYLQSLNKT